MGKRKENPVPKAPENEAEDKPSPQPHTMDTRKILTEFLEPLGLSAYCHRIQSIMDADQSKCKLSK
jgi:hypothetical protein